MALACGSASMMSTRLPSVASEAARLMDVVVFPTPPFWLAIAIILSIVYSFYECKGITFHFNGKTKNGKTAGIVDNLPFLLITPLFHALSDKLLTSYAMWNIF